MDRETQETFRRRRYHRRPVEVRVAKHDDRFRQGTVVYQELLENQGSYIFDDVEDKKPPERVPAGEVDDLIDEEKWLKDR